ncbi:MAG: diguanylate cyclase [Desulfuromonadales bacterium]
MPLKFTLFKKYSLIFCAIIGSSLLISGIISISFSYQENRRALIRLQREKAEAAAARIGQYLFDIEQRIGITGMPDRSVSALDQRCFEIQLLRRIAAINEITLLDHHGKEYLHVSRRAADVIRSGKDLSTTDFFRRVKSGRPYRSPIYFRNGALYMTLAMAVGPEEAGVTVAEIDLEFLLDGISHIKVGDSGHAYAVDVDGRLIAHPDIGLVLKNTSLASLSHVKAAINNPAQGREIEHALSYDGRQVLTAFGTIPQLGWFVFVEEALAEAYRPLYSHAIRSALLVLIGTLFTLLACVILVRRMVGPIDALQDGVTRIGLGVLDHRITVRTGDELEKLADGFNGMAEHLQESYATLEQKVTERTVDLENKNRELIAAIARQEELTAKVEALSATDGLTGIANRRRFDEVLDREHARLSRSGATLSLIMLDIDHFKAYNDNYGHVKGDDCLRQIARVIADCTTRPADLAARYGGEEFACILPETDCNGAVAIAEKIRRGIVDLAVPHKGSSIAEYVTASFGVVSAPSSAEVSALDIVSQVDELLYQAKSRGRNRVEFCRPRLIP